MSSNEHKSSGVPYPVKLAFGLLFMLGGFYLSVNVFNGENRPEFLTTLEHQGIPVDPGKTISVIGVLLILFPVIQSFFLAPLSEAINSRNSELEQTFSEAEELRNRMTTMRSEYEQRLAATEADARQKIEAQIREAQNLRQQLMSEASDRADELVRRAQQEIEQERDRVLTGLRTHVVDLALAAAEKVLVENMDDARNRRLVEDFVNQIEVAH